MFAVDLGIDIESIIKFEDMGRDGFNAKFTYYAVVVCILTNMVRTFINEILLLPLTGLNGRRKPEINLSTGFQVICVINVPAPYPIHTIISNSAASTQRPTLTRQLFPQTN